MCGREMKKKRSSVQAAHFYSLSPTFRPLTEVLRLIERINGSRDIINRMGDNGHPCLVTTYIDTGSDNEPLILTFACGP